MKMHDKTTATVFESKISSANYGETHAWESETDKQKEIMHIEFTERQQFQKSDRGENERTTSYLYDYEYSQRIAIRHGPRPLHRHWW